LGSVEAAFCRIGVAAQVVTEGASVRRADAVLLPGVGAFADAMAALKRRSLVESIRAAAAACDGHLFRHAALG
jgi:imidazole glycerol-phosphate synthase subunit HisH